MRQNANIIWHREIRASGGIGRLAGFRCQCSQGRAGSSPASRTIMWKSRSHNDGGIFYIFILKFQKAQVSVTVDVLPLLFSSGIRPRTIAKNQTESY